MKLGVTENLEKLRISKRGMVSCVKSDKNWGKKRKRKKKELRSSKITEKESMGLVRRRSLWLRQYGYSGMLEIELQGLEESTWWEVGTAIPIPFFKSWCCKGKQKWLGIWRWMWVRGMVYDGARKWCYSAKGDDPIEGSGASKRGKQQASHVWDGKRRWDREFKNKPVCILLTSEKFAFYILFLIL